MSIMAAELGVHIVLLCLVALHSKNNFNHAVWVFQLQQNDFLSIYTEVYFSHTEFYFSHAEFYFSHTRLYCSLGTECMCAIQSVCSVTDVVVGA